jgi:hypothetical protein
MQIDDDEIFMDFDEQIAEFDRQQQKLDNPTPDDQDETI